MSKLFIPPVALCFGLLSASAAVAQQVSLTMTDGRVTLKAQNATVRQILDEWARVGGTKIMNAEKIANQPVTLTLIDEPEGQALETILRSAAGYIVAERTNPTPTGSRFERIMVMARTMPVTTTASTGTTNQSAITAAGPTPPGGAFPAEGPVNADEDEPPQPMAPVVNPYAQPGGAPGAVSHTNRANNAAGGFSNLSGQQGAQQGATTTGVAGAVTTPPETKFDYANPQKYFQQQQLQQQGNPMQPYPGVAVSTSGVGTATTTPAQPTSGAVPGTGAAGTITPVTPSNQNPYSPNFNPYNLPPGQGVPGQGVPGAVGTTPQTTPTPVQPDRAKYANPYVQPNTQQPPE
jgi:hypothetical protein